jgi:hypothetical protein
MKLYAFGLCAAVALAAPLNAMAADAAKAPVKKAAAAAEKAAPASDTKLVAPEVLKAMGDLVQQGAQAASGSLQTADDFEPYAVLQRKDGSLQVVRWKSAENAATKPSALEVFKRVTLSVLDATRKDKDIVAAATFAASASTTNDGKTMVPMIRAEVDHRDGTPLIVLMPFQRKDGKLEFGSTPSLPGTNFLFFREDAAAAPAPAK